MNWKEYEIYITKHFQTAFPEALITHNVHVQGVISKIERQIDILISQRVAGFEVKIVIDCKYFSKKIDVKEVDSFIGFLSDVQASKGVLITNKGYTEAAKNRAHYDTRDVELRILNFSDLENFQNFIAIPYSGKYGAVVSAPEGWVVDSRTENGYLCSMYPVGLSRDEAYHHDGFVYVVFSTKDKLWPNLDHLIKTQQSELIKNYHNPKIEFIKTITRDDCNVQLRVIERSEVRGTIEYTLFLDFDEVIIFLTLLSPIEKSNSYLKKLEWVGEKLKRLYMLYDLNSKPIMSK